MKLSFIVCTRNRANAITGCLDSISAALDYAAPVDAEIIVVDNASEDDTSAVVSKWAESCVFPVKVLLEPNKGVSRARNLAIRSASGNLLAFTDDDCRLQEDYIRRLLQYDAEDTEPVLRGGRIELGDPEDLPLTIKTQLVAESISKNMHSARHRYLGGVISSCNMAMRRTVTDRLGFFDERFGPGTLIPASEDTDYISRAYLAGMIINYVPDLVVFHYHGRRGQLEGKKLMKGYMIGSGALYVKNLFKDPNLCRQLWWDVKGALKEILSGRNTCRPDIGFSHKDKVAYSVLGTMKFLFVLMMRRF